MVIEHNFSIPLKICLRVKKKREKIEEEVLQGERRAKRPLQGKGENGHKPKKGKMLIGGNSPKSKKERWYFIIAIFRFSRCSVTHL